MSNADKLIAQYKSEAMKAGFVSDYEVINAWRSNPDAMPYLFTLRMNAFDAKSNELGL